MERKILSFEQFGEWQKITERFEEISAQALNEGFSSSILRTFATQESGSRWESGLAKDMYSHSNVPLDKIQDTDFTILQDPSDYWGQRLNKDDNVVAFFVDDRPEMMKMWKEKKRWKGLEYGLILSILRGGVGMWTGFQKDAGSKFSRYRKSSTDRYGVLADEYDVESKYGWNNPSAPSAKVTKNNLLEFGTKVYVLDLNKLREKYGSTADIKNARRTAKSGATALKSADAIKKENIARYKEILQNRMDPKSMLDEIKGAMTTYLAWFTKKIDAIDFNKYDPSKEGEDYYSRMQVRWGNWNENMVNPISNMWRLVEDFMRQWDEVLRYEVRVEKIRNRMEAEKDETKKQRMAAEIDYYSKEYDRFTKKIIQYRDTLNQYVKDVKKVTG
jgi:hypothetical protein